MGSKRSGLFFTTRAAACRWSWQAVTLINRQDAVVVDIRDKEFEAGHIVDAIHIPLAKLKRGRQPN